MGVWLISLWPMLVLGSVRSPLLPPGLCRLLATPASCAPCTAPPPQRGPTLAALVRVVLSMTPCKKKQGDSPSGMAVRVICLEGVAVETKCKKNLKSVAVSKYFLNGFFFFRGFADFLHCHDPHGFTHCMGWRLNLIDFGIPK